MTGFFSSSSVHTSAAVLVHVILSTSEVGAWSRLLLFQQQHISRIQANTLMRAHRNPVISRALIISVHLESKWSERESAPLRTSGGRALAAPAALRNEMEAFIYSLISSANRPDGVGFAPFNTDLDGNVTQMALLTYQLLQRDLKYAAVEWEVSLTDDAVSCTVVIHYISTQNDCIPSSTHNYYWLKT